MSYTRLVLDRMQDAKFDALRSHSDYTRGITVFVEQHIVSSKTVLFGPMAAIVTRERMLRQSFMTAVSPDVQEMLRATIPEGMGMIFATARPAHRPMAS